MRSALREYLRILLRLWWQLLIGVGFGAVGAVMDMEVIAAPIPSWVLWSLALGTFAFAQFMSFATLHKEVSKYRSKPAPNKSIADLYNEIVFSILQDDDLVDHHSATINKIVEQAIMGNLKVFGTKTPPQKGYGKLEPIENQFWRDHEFEIPESHNWSRNEQIKQTRTVGEGEIYFNLKVDSSQVSICWPKKTRAKLQWPVKREIV